jgi:hypothetical protein
MSRFRNFCFTLNNYTDNDVEFLAKVECRYMCYGKEVGENGTPHLQGTVCFKNQITFAVAKKRLCVDERIHVEATKALDKSIDYCQKEGNFIERGERPCAGKRNDLDEFKIWAKGGINVSLKNAREVFSDISAKYPQFVEFYIADCRPKPAITVFPLRIWQANLNGYLNKEPVDREVVFIVDIIGNTGKTWFTRYYERNHDNVQVITPCKKVDMSYMLDETSRVVFIDCPRCSKEFLSYSIMEELKNGAVTSSKYMSRVKLFNKLHVVVMMNFFPDREKLSIDRYNIIEVTPAINVHEDA